MSTKVNATDANETVIRSVATIANKYGNPVFRYNINGTLCLVVDNFEPIDSDTKRDCWIPYSMIRAAINDDIELSLFILGLAKKLSVDNKCSILDVKDKAYECALKKMRIQADFKHHSENEVYDDKGNAYTKDGYHIIPDSIIFGFGDNRDAFDKRDYDFFAPKKSRIADI